MKHVVTGGVWHDPVAKKWVKAGPDITGYINEHPHQRHTLGFPIGESPEVGQYLSSLCYVLNSLLMCPGGAAHLPTHTNGNGKLEIISPVDWMETQAARCIGPACPQGNLFYQVTSFTAAQGDKPKVQTHIIIKHHVGYRISAIKEILVPAEQRVASHVVISLLEFIADPHPRLRVPCIKYPTPEEFVIVPPSVSSLSITWQP